MQPIEPSGIHKLRIPCINIAAVDVGLTIVAAWLLGWWFDVSAVNAFVGLMIAAILIHSAFGIDTQLNRYIASVFCNC
jgi:hypothetical protein